MAPISKEEQGQRRLQWELISRSTEEMTKRIRELLPDSNFEMTKIDHSGGGPHFFYKGLKAGEFDKALRTLENKILHGE